MAGQRGSDNLQLLALPEVQKELELVDEQKNKLKALGEQLRDKMREDFAGIRELSRDEARKKYEELRKKYEEQAKDLRKKVEGILLPHQLDRLREIRMQRQGARSLGSAEVVEALGITPEQKTKFEQVGEELRDKIRNVWQGLQGFRDLGEEERRAKIEENRKKMQEIIKQSTEKALGILSDEQRKTYQKMQGEKFEFQPRTRS